MIINKEHTRSLLDLLQKPLSVILVNINTTTLGILDIILYVKCRQHDLYLLLIILISIYTPPIKLCRKKYRKGGKYNILLMKTNDGMTLGSLKIRNERRLLNLLGATGTMLENYFVPNLPEFLTRGHISTSLGAARIKIINISV